MPVTWLDLLLLGVTLISGLIAMVRGLIYALLPIVAFGVAALERSCTKVGSRWRFWNPLKASSDPIFSLRSISSRLSLLAAV